MLANVYLQYVLDLWFEKCIKPQLKGEAYLVRYADDFIIMCQYENEAHAIFEALKERLAKFGLETADDKTKISLLAETVQLKIHLTSLDSHM